MNTSMRIPMTEYLEIDLETERWRCRRCAHDLGPARGNYKEGTLVYDRDPTEIHRPLIDPGRYEFTFAPDPAWCRILEYYCPGCGTQIEAEYLPPGHPPVYDMQIDIGGTFTDCFVAWDGRYIQAKALTTHHNLSQGFNEALDHACAILDLPRDGVLREVDSVRYATTLGTNALIERRGPQVGVVVTAGFEATIPLSRGRGYGEGLDELAKNDMSSGTRPDPLVPQTLIRSVAERVDYRGTVLMELRRDDVRQALRELIGAGAEALVVCLINAIENPAHELRVQEVFLSEYPAHQLGAIPMRLSHQLSGRKGEYVRATSAIVDGFLHATMYHALSDLEQNLREHGYLRPMLIIHNSGGMAQLNSTDALQTI